MVSRGVKAVKQGGSALKNRKRQCSGMKNMASARRRKRLKMAYGGGVVEINGGQRRHGVASGMARKSWRQDGIWRRRGGG